MKARAIPTPNGNQIAFNAAVKENIELLLGQRGQTARDIVLDMLGYSPLDSGGGKLTGPLSLANAGSEFSFEVSNGELVAKSVTSGANILLADSSGRIKQPNQPVWQGVPTTEYASGGFPVGSTVIPMTTQIDRGNNWNGTSHLFTCPVAGVYRITWHSLQLPPFVSSIGVNSTSGTHNFAHLVGTVSYVTVSAHQVLGLAANDTIRFIGWNGGGYYAGWTVASIELIG